MVGRFLEQSLPNQKLNLRSSKRHPFSMPFRKVDTDDLAINTIRILAADVVNKANSGHPGTPRHGLERFHLRQADVFTGAPMGMAPVAHILFSR